MHAFRRPVGHGRHGRALPGPDPDATPRGRDAPDQQRRRCHELRDAGAGQADPRLRRCGHPRGPDHRPPGDRRRAARDPRSRGPPAGSRHARHRRPGRTPGDGRDHGRRGERGRRRDPRRRHRVGHLRPGHDPSHRPALLPAVRGEPALREGPGGPACADRRRPRGPAGRGMVRRPRSWPAGWIRRPTSRGRAASPFARSAWTGSWAWPSRRRTSDSSWRVSGSRRRSLRQERRSSSAVRHRPRSSRRAAPPGTS